MKDDGKLAKRYARALFELCEVPKLDQQLVALTALANLWKGSAELQSALLNRATPIEQRVAVMQDLAAKLEGSKLEGSDKNFINFAALLVENERISLLPLILKVFSKMVDTLKKTLALEIISAFPISEQERGELKKSVEGQYGSMASIEWKVDRELIGGLIVKSGDKLLDSSVKGSLERIRTELIN